MAEKTIVVVEDEQDILELLEFHLEQEGFKTITEMDGAKAMDVIVQEHPDLVILDIMLPGMTGTEVCKELKQKKETRDIPIIILTAKAEEIDRVVGFELGAEDYVTKPFSPRELILRVKAILKRLNATKELQDNIVIDELTIDKAKHRVFVNDKPVELTVTEFNILLTLAERQGRVQSRDMLLKAVWGYDYAGFTRTVDTHIRRLRGKLGVWGERIETVRGIGYRIRETQE